MKTFEETVRAMSAKEIIMAMVEGLRNPKLTVNMSSFGYYDNGICYGCAATNAVCTISEKTFTRENINDITKQAIFLNSDWWFLNQFENAIDFLRKGHINNYNFIANFIGFAKIKPIYRGRWFKRIEAELPRLSNDYTEKQLLQYVKLAEAQK